MTSTVHFEHDFDALRAASTRVVIAVGAESEGQMASRAAIAVGKLLRTTPVTFPSHHGGFLGGEYGQSGDPEAFAATLHQVLGGEDGTGVLGTSVQPTRAASR